MKKEPERRECHGNSYQQQAEIQTSQRRETNSLVVSRFRRASENSLVEYMQHCSIVGDDDTAGQTPQDLILGHYVLPDGTYDDL
jgi:hypothetical protein